MSAERPISPAPPGSEPEDPELRAVAERYGRRASGALYSVLRPEVIRSTQEVQRGILALLAAQGGVTGADLPALRLVDVGCGYGGHLLDFLRFGFAPHNLTGLELLAERAAAARAKLPESLRIHRGDAATAPIAPASQDIVFQSVVFSSLLDDDYQQRLATAMWSWLRPGGAVLWYDFVYANPRNPDVRAMPVRRIRELFPAARLRVRRVTLAPPISRAVCRISPRAYAVFNALPWLRSHVLCWLAKP